MKFYMDAACISHRGKVRSNNEDNFYFDGKCMEAEHANMHNAYLAEGSLGWGTIMAVLDGMGGEQFGELASYAAARSLQTSQRSLKDFIIPERVYLERMTRRMNEAVVAAGKEQFTDRLGSTLVSLYFSGKYVYVCNVGDSRAYRLRDREFMQLSHDHVDDRPRKDGRKPHLNQHLGIDPEEMLIEPYIAKGRIQSGDQYLLCSDGLTDMVTNFEIADILLRDGTAEETVKALLNAALDKGGRDNITIILCKIR